MKYMSLLAACVCFSGIFLSSGNNAKRKPHNPQFLQGSRQKEPYNEKGSISGRAAKLSSLSQIKAFSGAETIILVEDSLNAVVYVRDSVDYDEPNNHLGFWKKLERSAFVFPEWFGAKGDGITDDFTALSSAFKSENDVYLTPKKVYNTSDVIRVVGRNGKNIFADRAVISRTNNSKKLLSFVNSRNINITGGKWQCAVLPTKNGGNSQNAIEFVSCVDVRVKDIWIYGSPEMGLAFMGCLNTEVLGNKVEKCFRDGIHHVYSANTKIIGNTLSDIKDDAIALVDYGIDLERRKIKQFNYVQAGRADVVNNNIENAYQGIAVLGCSEVNIKNNVVNNTVLAGIAVFSSEALKAGGKVSVKNVTIADNRLRGNCGSRGSIAIIGSKLANNGQASTGVAAIFIGTLNSSNLALTTKKRLKGIEVIDNHISESGVGGIWVQAVDGLLLSKNTAINCCIEQSNFSGSVYKIYNCTNALVIENSAVDSRVPLRHRICFDINGTSGKIVKALSRGWLAQEYYISKSTF